MMSSWNNIPDDVWEGDPNAPWNQVDDEDLLEWQKVNEPAGYLREMRDGAIDIDIFWLHDLGYTIYDVCEPDDITLDKYIEEVKADDPEAFEELKKDIEWI